jgi:CheY-like chemotaxis protein
VTSAERAARLTRQLLAFARKQIISPKLLNLNGLIADMDGMLRRLIRENVELVTVLAPELGAIHADPSQIEQVVLNLAVNARDAIPDGGTVTIETANVTRDQGLVAGLSGDTPGNHVMLSVSDTGRGMSPEVKAHLFEPFFTTKQTDRGTGLGLATVYGIVKQHEGEIVVRSEPGHGTTFTVYLPQARAEETAAAQRPILEEMAGGSETVLIVEDDPTVREVTARTLSRLGYCLLEAADGEEALRVAESYPGEIQLLITDVIMPGMGGRTLADRLRAVRPALKVLLMSGHIDDDLVQQGVLDGDMGFVQKPFDQPTLAAKVRELLDE